MALVNHETKEIHCKVLYTGPSQSGKTTSLKALYNELTGNLVASPNDLFLQKEQSSQAEKGSLSSKSNSSDVENEGLSQGVAASRYFEFLPLALGQIKSYQVRVHLYTRPYWGVYEALEGLLFHNLDGIAYVFDSNPLAMDDNIDELSEVKERLDDKGYNLSEFPQVFQYNKRDLGRKLPVNLLDAELNAYRSPHFESVATQSIGVKETLLDLSEQVLRKILSSKNEESH